MTSLSQKEYLKKYLSSGDKKKKKKSKKKGKKGIVILDNDLGDLNNIGYGYAASDEEPTVAEITYDCEKTRLLDLKKLKTVKSENRRNQFKPIAQNDQDESNPDASPPRKRYDSDDSPPRKRYDSDASPPRKRNDSDASPPRKRNDSDASPPRKRYDSDESPSRKRYDSDASPPRKGYDSDSSPPRKKAVPSDEVKPKKREFAHMSTREFLAARKKNKLKKIDDDELAKKERENKLQSLAEETHKKWNKGSYQAEQQQQRANEIVHEMGKEFARSTQDKDYNDYHKSKQRAEDPMLQYIAERSQKSTGPKKPIYQHPFPPNRFNIRPGYRWDGVDRSNGFENKYLCKQSSDKAVQEDAYKYMCEDL